MSSAWAKFNRAIRHYRELESRAESFKADAVNRITLTASLDINSGWHVIRIDHVPNYSSQVEEVSLGIGDLVNNLRCALDHLAWQYASAHAGGTPRKPREVYFPNCQAGSSGQHKAPGFLPPEFWVRLHEFQPCRGVNGRPDSWSGEYAHQLDVITTLSNDDKHQRLAHIEMVPNQLETIPARAGLPPWIDEELNFVPSRVNDPDPQADRWDFSQSSFRAEVGLEIARVQAPLWIDSPLISPVGTALPHFALPSGGPVVATMDRLVKYVRNVLEEFTG
ncbi:hypothetical protein [Streptomyces virginiae]|uniref:hypothetical protein n=1 Tax=Streptomyces virginiae TaxID=1961 RepID=UPI002DB982BE|nr:hypothetical protein [Streptomyces sp. CMAA1738]